MRALLTNDEMFHLNAEDAEELGAIKMESMFLKMDLDEKKITQERYEQKIAELQEDYDKMIARYSKK